MVPKWVQNGSKMGQFRPQNGPKMGPKWSHFRSGTRSRLVCTKMGFIIRCQDMRHPIWHLIWYLLASRRRGLKMGGPNTYSHRKCKSSVFMRCVNTYVSCHNMLLESNPPSCPPKMGVVDPLKTCFLVRI
jgi:hypothetical protein